MKYNTTILGLVILVALSACDSSQQSDVNSELESKDAGVSETQAPSSAANESEIERHAFFGDLHIHSSFSFDSYVEGNQMNDPRDTYRFARGETMNLAGGKEYRLNQPLDFAAVTDHAEGLADYSLCDGKDSAVYDSDYCIRARASDLSAFGDFVNSLMERPPQRVAAMRDPALDLDAANRGPWEVIRAAAEEFYEPGIFTTFIAYEYTGLLPGDGMMHRNVIFRGSKVPELALGAYVLHTPEALWEWLESACTDDCDVLAIPHNTNVSLGMAFRQRNTDDTPFTTEILARRARLEPLVEIHQHKGNSECALGVGNTDEECGFEQIQPVCADGETLHCIHPGSMVRNALKTGLGIAEQFGINPYKYGIIASTDTHNSAAGAVAEDRFVGHDSYNDDTPEKRLTQEPGSFFPQALRNPGGLAGIWSEENTRERLFAALQRKEVFGTSGPRLRVRFYGGWTFSEEMLQAPGMIAQAYRDGVPMGGDLLHTDSGGAPQFLVWAAKDANEANLERIQIIKGWRDAGENKERVYDVACGDGNQPDPVSHRCHLQPAAVDLATCQYSNDVGAAELSTLWTDLDFDPREEAFYYVRVLQIPTCRWTTYDANRLGIALPANLPATIRERGWSSPIWYRP
jgi:hypothetical protein